MYEPKNKPLLSPKEFARRILRSFFVSVIFLCISLFIGMSGYHWICKLDWVDSLLNASMILTGMGPVNQMTTESAKIFASFYALFSGIAFLSMVGVLIAPVAHRFMHKFHLEEEE